MPVMPRPETFAERRERKQREAADAPTGDMQAITYRPTELRMARMNHTRITLSRMKILWKELERGATIPELTQFARDEWSLKAGGAARLVKNAMRRLVRSCQPQFLAIRAAAFLVGMDEYIHKLQQNQEHQAAVQLMKLKAESIGLTKVRPGGGEGGNVILNLQMRKEVNLNVGGGSNLIGENEANELLGLIDDQFIERIFGQRANERRPSRQIEAVVSDARPSEAAGGYGPGGGP